MVNKPWDGKCKMCGCNIPIEHQHRYDHRCNKCNVLRVAQYHKLHPEIHNKIERKYNQSPKGKYNNSKHNNKRERKLEFDPINIPTSGDLEAHHITKKYVVYIPKYIHRFIYHNIFTNRGMDHINYIVLNYLFFIYRSDG
jgi:hypothetical protein